MNDPILYEEIASILETLKRWVLVKGKIQKMKCDAFSSGVTFI